ncbi:hypothetical protein PK28_04080 [Hymenobacter sp. DG25B]|uniref:hypothetical protein n=1 Tax=Hymenobacter sp. DG25B TaxID=1385664 RepID=UPI000540A2FD|nr:hypothetical protein [Hymenobacter sp. DG25B]AIZ63078.1 hypothetical protein PK28_04080 [Hymenobacter sp. DG25B]
MLALKRLVTILVMVYLLLALLFILSPATRDAVAGAFGLGTDMSTFYWVLFIVAAVLLAVQLLVENLDSTMLRRNISQHEGKINELKARLYDQQMELREREFQQRPGVVTGTTTYPETVYTPSPTTTPVPEATRPVFPQEDPSLPNAPLQQPNSIIPPASPDVDERPVR